MNNGNIVFAGPYTIRRANWPDDQAAIFSVREDVFVNEQQVPLDLERDGLDPDCSHVLAEDTERRPIGTGRLLADGHIGRVAVLRAWRGQGVGKAMMIALMKWAAEKGMKKLLLNSQEQAIRFYQDLGFVAVGEIFFEAGIPHQCMEYPPPS
jgi:predicted GNAT family N-acyltransferase